MCHCVFSHLTCSTYATNICNISLFCMGNSILMSCSCAHAWTRYIHPKWQQYMKICSVQCSFTSCIRRLKNSLNAVNNDEITNIEWILQKCLKLQIEQKHFSLATPETFIFTVTWSSWLVSHMMLFAYIRMECEQSLCGISKDIKTISECYMVCCNKQQRISSLCLN